MAGHNTTGAADGVALDKGETMIAPPIDEPGECTAFACPTDPADVAWLSVTFEGSVDSVIDGWQHHKGKLPGALGVVSVNETTRGAATTHGLHDVVDLADEITSTVVQDPTDLTHLGFRTSRCLGALEDGAHDELVVCLDSLTALLRVCEVKPVFRFLHVLTSRLRKAGARGHFHYDPAVHDDRTSHILAGVVDDVQHLTAATDAAEKEPWPGDWESAVPVTDTERRPESE